MGCKDNEMEWKARPMLCSQRIYLQHGMKLSDVTEGPPSCIALSLARNIGSKLSLDLQLHRYKIDHRCFHVRTLLSSITTKMSTSSPALEPQPPIDESARVAPGSQDVHDAIRDLLADEYPALSAYHGGRVDRKSHFEINSLTVNLYFKFISKTWAGIALSFFRMLTCAMSRGRLLFTPDAFDSDTCPPFKAHTASLNS